MRFTYLHHRRENKHMEKFSQLVTWVDGKVWGWGMILLLLGTHLFMTVRTGFIQRKTITKGIKLSVSKEPDADGEVSQFGALATALASTIAICVSPFFRTSSTLVSRKPAFNAHASPGSR